jgi:hypothetical protein
MQKVEGSSPFIRSSEPAGNGGFFYGGKRMRLSARGPGQVLLARNDWLHVTVEGRTLKLRLGAHAKKIRAGKKEVEAIQDLS